MSIRSFKYRIYLNKVITDKLQWVLDRRRELYNAALQERKEAWKYAKKHISQSERWHSCECGIELERDINAALNILRRGLQIA